MCKFCGAPLAHATGLYCSPDCQIADTDDGPIQGPTGPPRDVQAWPPF